MLYEITDGTLSLGGSVILSHFEFRIKGSEKAALVGDNGAGKTTLLRLIAVELSLDRDDRSSGGIRSSEKLLTGYLPQHVFESPEDGDRTVEEELLAAAPSKGWDRERFEYEQEYDRIFTGFGFSKEDKRKRLADFSGGQRMRIALIRLMLMKPDILLLDEPTNHLDEEMTIWLENWIRNYEKAVICVSHDRYFLDRIADHVWEVRKGKLTPYTGGYTEYVRQKREKNLRDLKEWRRQQEEVERLEALITRFKNKPRKAAFARSRKKILDRMDRMEKPDEPDLGLDRIENAEDRMTLEKVFTVLPEDVCRIIMLHAVSGMKHREIADLLNMPTSTVLSKYNRGIQKLRSELEGML